MPTVMCIYTLQHVDMYDLHVVGILIYALEMCICDTLEHSLVN